MAVAGVRVKAPASRFKTPQRQKVVVVGGGWVRQVLVVLNNRFCSHPRFHHWLKAEGRQGVLHGGRCAAERNTYSTTGRIWKKNTAYHHGLRVGGEGVWGAVWWGCVVGVKAGMGQVGNGMYRWAFSAQHHHTLNTSNV